MNGLAKQLGLHERLELHELLTFKNLCLTKSAAMLPLAQDDTLKEFLSDDIRTGKQCIEELRSFFTERNELH